jgi:membrane peptidoglycan carboxypeptidase
LANSYNIPAVKIAQNVGVPEIVDMGQQMGIKSWSPSNDYGLSITLGGANVTMLDMATVYGTLANNGKRVDLDPILEVRDYEGRTIYKKHPEPVQVLKDGVAAIMSQMLSDGNARARAFGTNSILNIPGSKVAVKTGTTDNKRDNWTIGYTPRFVVATWVGNNDNTVMSPYLTSGVTGAAPMWAHITSEMLEKYPSTSFEIPNSIVGRSCFGYEAYFLRGTESSQCKAVNASASPSIFPQL